VTGKIEQIEEQLGFVPPALNIAEKLGEDYADVIADYFNVVYRDEVISPKYKALLGIATGIMAEHKSKVLMDVKKAYESGANKEEIIEVLRMMVWWCGAPTLVNILPQVLNEVEKYEDKQGEEK